MTLEDRKGTVVGVLVLPTRVSSSPRLAVCGFVVLNVLLF